MVGRQLKGLETAVGAATLSVYFIKIWKILLVTFYSGNSYRKSYNMDTIYDVTGYLGVSLNW